MDHSAQASEPRHHLRPWSPSYGLDVHGNSSSNGGPSGAEQHDYGYGQAGGYPRSSTVETPHHEYVDGDDEMTNVDSISSVGSVTNADSVTNVDNDAANSEHTNDTEDMSDYGEMSSTRTETVHSSILEHDFEGGRRYHHYRNGRYPLPNDDVEQNREISKHFVHMELTDGKLFNAPINEFPQRIMDLCTGTGQWPVAAADEFPGAEIVGVDLSPIQPLIVPPNLHFLLDDVEDEWLDHGDYDLIHMRFSCMYIRDMQKLLRNIYNHLKPGAWAEFAEFGFEVFSDDGTMPKDWGFATFTRLGFQAFLDGGLSPGAPDEMGDELHQAGFANIQSKFLKTPVGEWPDDPKQKFIGALFRDNLVELVNASPKVLGNTGLDDAEIELFLIDVRKSLYDTDVHAKMMFKSWWGQRPDEDS